MAKTCPIPQNQEEIESYIADRLINVKMAFMDVFGILDHPTSLGVNLINNTIQNKQNELNNLRDQLSVAKLKQNLTEIGEINNSIKTLKSDIKKLDQDIKDSIKRVPIIQEMEEIITQKVIELMDTRFMDDSIDPKIIMEVLKDSMFMKLTKTYNSLNDIHPNTLIGVREILKAQLKKQIKESKKERKTLNKFGTWWANTEWHPLVVTRLYDATGRAYKVMKAAVELAEKAFGSRAKHVNMLTDINEDLVTMIDGREGGREYMFLQDTGEAVTDHDKRMSLKKIWKFLTEVGTGEVRNIEPTPMFVRTKNGDLKFTEEFSKDVHEYNKIVNTNAQNGIGAGGWVQEYIDPKTKKTHKYVIIKKINENTGEEIYKAYQAPWNEQFGNLEKAPRVSNIEFYQRFQQEENNTIGGFVKWNHTTQKYELIPGVMPKGWYRAKDHRPLSGVVQWDGKNMKKGQEFTTNSDMDFRLDDELNQQDINPLLWSSLKKIRDALSEVREDVISRTQVQEARMLKVLQKLLPGENLTKNSYSKKKISQLLAESKHEIDIDQLDMNITVRNGRIYTHNTDFAELENYWPMKYQFWDLLRTMFQSNIDMETKMDGIVDELNSLVGIDTEESIDRRTELKDELLALEEDRNYNNDVINYRLGLTTERPKFTQVTQIRAVKSRTAISSPMPRTQKITVNTGELKEDGTPETVESESKIFGGMRKDSGVINEYLKETYISLEQNEVKILLLEAIAGGMSKGIQDYVVDHVRASFGHKDVESAFLFINFKWLADKMGIKEGGRMERLMKFTNKSISSSYLDSPWVSTTNNMQRMGYNVVATFDDMWRALNMTPKEYKEIQKYAALAGVTDEIATLTDVLMGESDAAQEWYSGYGNKRHLALLFLTSSRQEFVRKALKTAHWRVLAEKLGRRIGEVDLATARELALDDLWELTVGLKKRAEDQGPMTDAQKKAFIKTLNGAYSDKVVDAQLKFAFGGSAMIRFLGLNKKLGWLVTFTESEKRMREEALYIAGRVMMREGAIDQEWIDSGKSIYEHPEVVKYTRLLVNNVMFSMSKANLSKFFHGPIGELLGKFKPYMWNQLGVEYNIMSNWMRQLKGMDSYKERAKMIGRIFRKPQGEIEKQVRNYFFSRGMFGAVSQFLSLPAAMTWTPGRGLIQYGLKTTGLGWRPFASISRGGSAQLLEMIVKTVAFSMAMGGALEDDDEDKVYQEFYRYFLPIMLNIIVDSIYDEDPFKAVEIYSETLHDVLYESMQYALD